MPKVHTTRMLDDLRWREIIEMRRMFLKHVALRRPIDVAGLYSLPGTQQP